VRQIVADSQENTWVT